MEYLPEQRLCFVHVPKNAGKSVRAALAALGGGDSGPMAADLGLPADRVREAMIAPFAHPDLGRIHLTHLPLWAMAAHFPACWAAFRGARSFCLTRAPRARFISALLQHLREFEDLEAVHVGDPAVRAAAERVCERLERGGDRVIEARHIHFARQTDFTDLDGIRQVTAIFPMDATGAMEDWLRRVAGVEVTVERTHTRRQPKPWAQGVQPVARFVGRRLMPGAVKRLVYPLWTRSPVFDDARGSYAETDLGPAVEAFIRDRYAADAALHAEALAAVAAGVPA
jgi:hypothetical protein